MIVLDALSLPFMQRAAAEVALLAPLAGLLGAQIVLRRLAFFTHAVGAAAFPGLVLAGPAGLPPAVAALGAGGAFAGIRDVVRRRAGVAGDAATALCLVTALAVGIVLASDVFESGAEVDGLLFGSLLAIGPDELALTAAAVVVATLVVAGSRRTWIATGFDPASAGSLGLPRAAADWALLGAVTLGVVAAIDATGAMLVGALMVIPAATVRLWAGSVAGREAGAVILALLEGFSGLAVAYELDVPPGATTAVIGGLVFAAAVVAAPVLRRVRA